MYSYLHICIHTQTYIGWERPRASPSSSKLLLWASIPHTHIHTCLHMCVYIYTHIHTYIHTYINRLRAPSCFTLCAVKPLLWASLTPSRERYVCQIYTFAPKCTHVRLRSHVYLYTYACKKPSKEMYICQKIYLFTKSQKLALAFTCIICTHVHV